MTEKKIEGKTERFLFDQNDFADGHLDTIDGNEPPPVFNEEELEAAKKEAYALGKTAGATEAHESREQSIAEIIKIISRDTSILFEAEAGREKTYELESLKLSLAIFKKLLPHYTKNHGLDELKEAITSTLKTKTGQGTIAFEVHPDAISSVESYIDTIQAPDENRASGFTVKGNDTLGLSDCQLSWADGGALRNSQSISGEIEALLLDALAANGVNVHDEIDEASSIDESSEEIVVSDVPDADDNENGETT